MIRRMPILRRHRGTSMIEVLVTIVVLAFGLLGLVGLQAKLQVSEVEAYQRAQALILLQDMATRIASNRTFASTYVTASPLGSGGACPSITSGSTRQQIDASEWCNTLQGAAEISGADNIGAIIGGRGCVESVGSDEYMVTVAWQGIGPLASPPASVTCGQGLYNGPSGSSCANELCRRVVTTIVRIAALV